MSKYCTGLLLLALASSCSAPTQERTAEPPAVGPVGNVFGDGVTLEDTTEIGQILASPDAFIGKPVAVKGRVTEVCPRMGCWMEIESNSSERIRIKVEDGVIVFPADAVGKEVVAEGEVERLDMTREEYVSWFQHMAEEKGETFDESTVGDPPYQIIRIRGKGAEIRGNS